jgi:hypothetical protein
MQIACLSRGQLTVDDDHVRAAPLDRRGQFLDLP